MRISALTFSGLALVLFACSSEAPSGSTRGAASPAANQNDDDGDDKQTKAGDTSATEPVASGGSCAAQPKLDACYECCEAASPSGVELLAKTFGECICAADKCGTACAQSACVEKDPQQGDACDTCIQQQFQACDTAAIAKCEADASCKKLFECEAAAKCDEKPE